MRKPLTKIWSLILGIGAIFGISTSASATPTIASRVSAVREQLSKQSPLLPHLSNGQSAEPAQQTAQWVNWANWLNWANWTNWANWANWLNWFNT
jgi:hypothetical protein